MGKHRSPDSGHSIAEGFGDIVYAAKELDEFLQLENGYFMPKKFVTRLDKVSLVSEGNSIVSIASIYAMSSKSWRYINRYRQDPAY